jgi:hypothetical protein
MTSAACMASQRRWEGRVFALSLLVNIQGLGAGPSGRVVREGMDPAHYTRDCMVGTAVPAVPAEAAGP